jgi:TonB-dependent SusC/RagA subfamily outer membrane receptor
MYATATHLKPALLALAALVAGMVTGCHPSVGSAELDRIAPRASGSVLERSQMNPVARNFTDLISGRLPGVDIMGYGQDIVVRIRGISTFSGNPNALIVVDGIQSHGRALAAINPDDVERVEVLKDGSAAQYGVRGGNGVLVITTRRR